MPSLLIKNIPEELRGQLRERAARHHRSMNKEVIVLLERALGGPRTSALPEPIALRKPLDTKTLLRARKAGRE
jgi:plasmid stability protein